VSTKAAASLGLKPAYRPNAPKPRRGLRTQIANDKGRSHQQPKCPFLKGKGHWCQHDWLISHVDFVSVPRLILKEQLLGVDVEFDRFSKFPERNDSRQIVYVLGVGDV